MPYYEYRCAGNGRVVELRHAMDEEVRTWGELCARAGTDPGSTPGHAPVERLMSAPVPAPAAGSADAADFGGCGAGCACAAPGA